MRASKSYHLSYMPCLTEKFNTPTHDVRLSVLSKQQFSLPCVLSDDVARASTTDSRYMKQEQQRRVSAVGGS